MQPPRNIHVMTCYYGQHFMACVGEDSFQAIDVLVVLNVSFFRTYLGLNCFFENQQNVV